MLFLLTRLISLEPITIARAVVSVYRALVSLLRACVSQPVVQLARISASLADRTVICAVMVLMCQIKDKPAVCHVPQGSLACSTHRFGPLPHAMRDAEFRMLQPLTQCEDCPEGTFAVATGQWWCDACPRGRFSDQRGTVVCLECQAGSFNNDTGQTACSVR